MQIKSSTPDSTMFSINHMYDISLVPSPRKSGLVHTVHACARIYGKPPVNVFVNEFSHMAMSSMEAVYEYKN